ncbi:hypothetical protein HPB50_025821 [Hyalomma asiaticum]|uniref:Uncharacterized protein n=1 Tax=Hyalomma asiaticum TaxID=266040 RepID=A0ACB7SRD9_HYAAI|nr:hypothetical protein HPB50_025821 [Hyalomma asiaticum]
MEEEGEIYGTKKEIETEQERQRRGEQHEEASDQESKRPWKARNKAPVEGRRTVRSSKAEFSRQICLSRSESSDIGRASTTRRHIVSAPARL